MKKYLFLLLLIPLVSFGQAPLRLPYYSLLQVYHGDTIKQYITGDSAKWHTNKDFFSLDKPLVIQGHLVGSAGTETDPVFGASVAKSIKAPDTTRWSLKQNALISGTNIKTFNGSSILTSGNIAAITGSISTFQIPYGNFTGGVQGAGTFMYTGGGYDCEVSGTLGNGMINLQGTNAGVQSVNQIHITGGSDGEFNLKRNSRHLLKSVAEIYADSIDFNGDVVLPNLKTGSETYLKLDAAGKVITGSGGGSSSITSAQIIDSISNHRALPTTKKISFTKLNGQILPYQLTTTTYLDVDTVGSISGASNIYQILGLNGSKINHANRFSPVDTNYTYRSINTITGKLYTWLAGCFGSGNYRIFKYNLIDSTTAPGAPIQLAAPGSFQAIAASQTQINLSWTLPSPNGRNFQIYDSIVGVSSNFTNLLSSPVKSSTGFNHAGLSNGTHVYYRIRTVGSGTDTLTSAYATANATTSNLSALTAPTLNSITVADSVSLPLSWNQITNNSGYRVWRSGDNSTYTRIATTTTNTNSYSNTGLTKATLYYYKVVAHGDSTTYSDSPLSTAQSATTWGGFVRIKSANTNSSGTLTRLVFTRGIGTGQSSTGISFSPSNTIASMSTSANGDTLICTMGTAWTNGQTITVSYTPGTIVAADLGKLASFSGVSVTNNTVGNTYPLTNLLGYYSFNGNANVTAGTLGNGTVGGTASLVADRYSNASKAYEINASGEYVKLPVSSGVDYQNFTIAMWVKLNGNIPSYGALWYTRNTIISGVSDASGTAGLVLNNQLAGTVGNGTLYWTYSLTLSTSAWVHVAFVFTRINAAALNLTIYKNGASIYNSNGVGNGIIAFGGNFYIGNDPAATGRYINGAIDDVFIYDRALNSSEITQLYNYTE